MADIPTLTGQGRLPAVAVPVARLRLPTPTAGGAVSLARAGGLIAEIGLRNQQAERSNDFAELKLRILQARDEGAQAAQGAKAGTQVPTFNGVFDRLREDFEQIDDDRLREPALINLEATRTLMQPKLRALESSMLVDRANATTIEARSALMAAGTIGTRAEFESAISSFRGLWDDRVAVGTADEGPAAAEIARFEGELTQNRSIELATTDPAAAKALLDSPRGRLNLTAKTRASILRTIDAKVQDASKQNAVTLLDVGIREVDTMFLDEHPDPVQINNRVNEVANEIAAHKDVKATPDEIKLILLQNAMANAAQTGDWRKVQILEPVLSKTLEGQTAFDKMRDAARAKIQFETRQVILQAAADGQITEGALRDWALDAGQRWLEDPENDPLAFSPDAAQDIVNRALSIMGNKAADEGLRLMYRSNMLLPGIGTKGTQQAVDEQARDMLADIMQERGFNPQDPNDVIRGLGVLAERTNRTGALPTAVKDGIVGGMRSPKTIDLTVDLSRQIETNAPFAYKSQIDADTRAVARQYFINKLPSTSAESAFDKAIQTVFEIKPVRTAALVTAQKGGLREKALTSLFGEINERFDLALDVDKAVKRELDISSQISNNTIELYVESVEGEFLRGHEDQEAIRRANEQFFKTHDLTGIDSRPRLMLFAPEASNVYAQDGWGTTEMRNEFAQDLIEHSVAGNLELPTGIAPPQAASRKVAAPTARGAIFLERSDEEVLTENIRVWSDWIKENVILEPDTNNLNRTRLGPKPAYVVMVIGKDGPEAVRISRGELAAQPLVVEFNYENSRLSRKRFDEAIEEARAAIIEEKRAMEFRRRVSENFSKFGPFTGF